MGSKSDRVTFKLLPGLNKSDENQKCIKDVNKCKDAFHLSDEYWQVENFSRLGYVDDLSPGGISTDCIEHYAQLLRGPVKELIFNKFDYGSDKENIAQ